MKKFLTIATAVIMAMGCAQVQAQDSAYRDEFKKIMSKEWIIVNNTQADNLVGIFAHLLSQRPDYTNAANLQQDAGILAKKYYESQMMDDMVDLMLPYYSKTLSLEDLQKINTTASDPKISAIGKKFQSPEVAKKIEQVMTSTIMQMAYSNGESQPVVSEEEKKNDFYIATSKLCEKTGMIETMSSTFSAMSAQATTAEQKQLMDKIFTNITKEMPSIIYLAYKEVAAIEEIETLNSIFDKPEYRKLKPINLEVSKNIMTVAQGIMIKANEWLQKQELK